MISRDETFWLGQSIAHCMRAVGWIKRTPPPPAPKPKPERPARAYNVTLPGVTYDQRNNVLKASFNYSRGGKRAIYLANAAPTWENEQRLSRMWQAARAAYQAGGDEATIRAAAREVDRV